MTGRTTTRPLRAKRDFDEDELSRLAFDDGNGEGDGEREGKGAAPPTPTESTRSPEPFPPPSSVPVSSVRGERRDGERLVTKTLRTTQGYVDLIAELCAALDVTENKLMRQLLEPQLDGLEQVLREEGRFGAMRRLMELREGT